MYTTQPNLVLCLDEKTSLQPSTRLRPTRPARAQQPNQVEAEYERKGSLNLLAAFDTRTGQVYVRTEPRKRQSEFIALLEQIEAALDPAVKRIHIVLDNVPMHKGKLVQAWWQQHPRFECHFPPVHCSWMNQVEQWFSILQRKRMSITDFESIDELAQSLEAFVQQWNVKAHAFKWNSRSFDKGLAKCEEQMTQAAA